MNRTNVAVKICGFGSVALKIEAAAFDPLGQLLIFKRYVHLNRTAFVHARIEELLALPQDVLIPRESWDHTKQPLDTLTVEDLETLGFTLRAVISMLAGFAAWLPGEKKLWIIDPNARESVEGLASRYALQAVAPWWQSWGHYETILEAVPIEGDPYDLETAVEVLEVWESLVSSAQGTAKVVEPFVAAAHAEDPCGGVCCQPQGGVKFSDGKGDA